MAKTEHMSHSFYTFRKVQRVLTNQGKIGDKKTFAKDIMLMANIFLFIIILLNQKDTAIMKAQSIIDNLEHPHRLKLSVMFARGI